LARIRIYPLHIAKFVVPPYAGIEKHVDNLARELMPEIEATVLAGNLLRHGDYDKPYKFYPVKTYAQVDAVYVTPGVVRKSKSLLSSGECNLLHVHSPNPWADFAALNCRDIPLVVTWHSDIVRQAWLMKWYRKVQLRIIERADKIIITTPNFLRSSEQLAVPNVENKIEYVPLGTNVSRIDMGDAEQDLTEQVRQFASGRRILLTVGRHVGYKGYENLLKALSRSPKNTCLVMVGYGPLTKFYRRLIVGMELEGRVLMLPLLTEGQLIAAYQVCDFFVLPSISRAEAFGLASAEAMAFGKPTIVCRLGNGVDYLNRHMETSICVTPGDVAGLTNAITRLSDDDSLRQYLGVNARQWVRAEFSMAKTKQKMIQIYQKLI
jgi:glycosyltransferase involved in cell wall biosynthesis